MAFSESGAHPNTKIIYFYELYMILPVRTFPDGYFRGTWEALIEFFWAILCMGLSRLQLTGRNNIAQDFRNPITDRKLFQLNEFWMGCKLFYQPWFYKI